MLIGGLMVLASGGLLFLLFFLEDVQLLFLQNLQSLRIAGIVGLLAGLAVFSAVAAGRTWRARASLSVLVLITVVLCQTNPLWLPYLIASEDPPPLDPSVQPVAKKSDAAKKKQESPDSEGKLTLKQLLADHVEPAIKAISSYKGYSCTFHKREWAKGLLVGARLIDETIDMKIRHEPFSVYLHFRLPKGKLGTEALYVKGKNNGNVVAHSTKFFSSLLGTIRVPPTDSKIMADNRYPITNIGMKNILLTLKKNAKKYKDETQDFAITLVKDRKIDGRPCKCIELYNPTPSKKFPLSSARLYIDRKWNVPIGYESYEKHGEKMQLVEFYRYTKIKFNPGLKDSDFDPDNADYGYPP